MTIRLPDASSARRRGRSRIGVAITDEIRCSPAARVPPVVPQAPPLGKFLTIGETELPVGLVVGLPLDDEGGWRASAAGPRHGECSRCGAACRGLARRVVHTTGPSIDAGAWHCARMRRFDIDAWRRSASRTLDATARGSMIASLTGWPVRAATRSRLQQLSSSTRDRSSRSAACHDILRHHYRCPPRRKTSDGGQRGGFDPRRARSGVPAGSGGRAAPMQS